jgi:hypothetical protein
VIVPPIDAYGAANATSAPCGDPVPQDGWRTCQLPNQGAVVDWPDQSTNVWGNRKSFVFTEPGHYATWLGEQRTEIGRPLIWYDVGSGFPPAVPSIGYQFPLAGKYAWECLVCSGVERDKLNGTMYVIGPRAMITPKLVSPDNSGSAITYGFDASASFVTDHQPYNIVEYSFDFQDDGTFDQTSPEPFGTYTYAPGPQQIRVRVKDDHVPARYGEYTLFLEIPYVRPGNPEPNPIADSGKDSLNPTGVKFSKANVKLKASKSIRLSLLRKKGLSVKITGLTKGDRLTVKLLKGKKTIAAKSTVTSATSKTVRLRMGRKGRRTLYAGGVARRLVIDVAVEGTDGFTTNPHPRLGVRLK